MIVKIIQLRLFRC